MDPILLKNPWFFIEKYVFSVNVAMGHQGRFFTFFF